jgi:hypothetical protein
MASQNSIANTSVSPSKFGSRIGGRLAKNESKSHTDHRGYRGHTVVVLDENGNDGTKHTWRDIHRLQ